MSGMESLESPARDNRVLRVNLELSQSDVVFFREDGSTIGELDARRLAFEYGGRHDPFSYLVYIRTANFVFGLNTGP